MNLVKTIFIILFAFPCLVKPQQIINQKQNGQPVEIYAEEGIEWHKNDNKYLAIGNAIAKSGTMSVKSDRIEAFYEDKDNTGMDINVKAHKKVVVKDENLKITGGNSRIQFKKRLLFNVGKKLILTSEKINWSQKKKWNIGGLRVLLLQPGKLKRKGNEFEIKLKNCLVSQ